MNRLMLLCQRAIFFDGLLILFLDITHSRSRDSLATSLDDDRNKISSYSPKEISYNE